MANSDWDRTKVKRVLEALRELKDFDKLPLPMEIHKAFDIPLNKPKNDSVMKYFENYLNIQSLPVDSVQTIDGRVAHKDVKFPTSILEPFKLPADMQPDESTLVIMHTKDDKVFSNEVESTLEVKDIGAE
jgi:helix-turn-helix protein